MEGLYIQQIELADNINKLLINYKKDSSERKTIDYCERRLELLESHWRNYEINNEKLLPFEYTNHKYFVNSEYEHTKEIYLTCKHLLTRTIDSLNPKGKQNVSLEPSQRAPQEVSGESSSGTQQRSRTATTPTFESRGSSSKLDDMLRKQSVQFKAFVRAVDSIDLESMKDKWEYEDALHIIQSRWTAVDNLHWDIIAELEEDEAYESHFNKHERTFNSMRKAINSKMWSTSYRDKTTPKMDIPVFTGNYHQWVSFKDLFNESIHLNPSISNAQKMQYLKSKVKGEAERLIQHLAISSDNYIICWEILNHRFDNKKIIFTSHINMFLNLPNIQQQSFIAIKKLHDITLESLHAIKNLGVDIETWDPLLVHLLSQKLDSATYGEYIESLKNSRDLPVLQEFLNFLESKFTSLESSRRRQDNNMTAKLQPYQKHTNNNLNKSFINYPKQNYNINNNHYKSTKQVMSKSMHVSAIKCPLCFAQHNIAMCKKFNDMSHEMKYKTLCELRFCINCIYDHNGNKCRSTKRCKVCSGNHHTILHENFRQQKSNDTNEHNNKKSSISHDSKSETNGAYTSQRDCEEILLATALVNVAAADGTQFVMRALIDQGSQISLISEHAAQQLGLKRQPCKGVIYGIGEKENNSKGMLSITCQSIHTDFKFNANVLIMNNLIKKLPNRTFDKPSWSHITHISLADPEFYVSRPVDLLLGAEIYSIIMLDGIIRGSELCQPLAQQSQLGWLLCGSAKTFHCNVILNNIEDIQEFWNIEDIQRKDELSAEDQECVEYYISTTKRLESGRYEVSLPMKQQAAEKLGSSKAIALAQFRNLEQKFERQAELAKQYKQFMREYEQLQHMELASLNNKQLECFLPHHGVLKPDSSTTQLRVVFNASSKTSSGHSLNDLMHKGPNLQQDLQQLILRWRQYRYAYTADIEKMYRQILVNQKDQNLQQIIWREHMQQPIKSYKLTTITYGTKAAPFLAMMTLRQLASDEEHNFPIAALSLREDFYMDDLVSGAHTIDDGKQKINELSKCLQRGGFILRKWSANKQQLLENIPQCDQNILAASFVFKTENTPKTLGLRWNPDDDVFIFQYEDNTDANQLTKRKLLSEISKIFDPLGWLAPLTMKMKLLFQKVWLNSQMQWSDEVSDEVKGEWITLKEDLKYISQLNIPRWLHSEQEMVLELHGFCDASTKAYAAVIYARIVKENKVSIVLVASKTKLVPTGKTISLPRLELCAAELLTRLLDKVSNSLLAISTEIYCWSDSKVTLSWIQGNPDRWKTFVSNRVKKIVESVVPEKWQYVKSSENPADAASRGLSPSLLIKHLLWWQGPQWLSAVDFKVKQQQDKFTTEEEAKKQSYVVQNPSNDEPNVIDNILSRYSSFSKIMRILSWILRAGTPSSKQKLQYLTLKELKQAKLIIIKHVQYSEFTADIIALSQNKTLSSNSKLSNLNPFLDQEGVLRVGGRLKNASISDDMKYPIIIPYSNRLTELLIQQAHELTYHGGARLTMSLLRQKYWILKGNRSIKKQLRGCVTCKKHEPRKLNQIMGDLPDFRSNPAPAFYHTGIDFTGFISVKINKKSRGMRTMKGYIALFICMVTKAVHLEIVSDLTSASFIAALRRMTARRGSPKHIYSDNGTNFVGANNILQEEQQQLENIFKESFHKEIADMEIEWHWNCPSWPSAGGIWERSIRSLKQHLKRVIGEQALTFEEYSTLLAQIEACLNTRPLCSMSEDINDIDFLTPAHFLTSRGELTIIETAHDARTRWHLTNKLFQNIWRRWKTEYLCQLSVRTKWIKAQKDINIGDMVTIHDDNLPAGKWPVGRVVEVHPGKDGHVRVVTLKTKNGYIKRPVVKLSILPIQEATQSSINMEKGKVLRGNSLNKLVNIALSLLILFNVLSFSEASINFTQINNNNSLYFDPIGKMHLIRDNWKIIAYYDMNPYWQGDKAVNDFSKYLKEICKKIKQPNHCIMILGQIRHDHTELQYYNQLLLNQHFGARTRVRRGLINVVGSIANTLFGVLDESFAQKYQEDIKLIHEKEDHLTQLWRNQTSIIEAEYNILKRTEATIDEQHKIINKHLNYLDNATNKIQSELNQITIQQDFTIISIATNNMIQNLKRIQDTLIDTITEIYHGQINLHLITPQQLSRELQIIASQTSKELTLPVESIQANIYSVYKLLKIKARMTEEYLIFEITLPLINRDNFQLYKLIPIPYQIGQDMVTIESIAEVVAINLKRDSFLTTSVYDLHTCEYLDETYICQIQDPIRHLEPDEKFCKTNQASTCNIIKNCCKNIWIQLHEPSTYFYFCCDTYSLRIICDDVIQARYVSKVGLVRLTKQCIIKGQDITLYSYQQSESALTIKPSILINKLTPINHLVNITLPFKNIQNIYDEKSNINLSLKTLGDQIKLMKESALQTDILTSHDIHHYTIIYGLLGIAIVVVLCFLWKRGRRVVDSSHHPRSETTPSSNVNISLNQPVPSEVNVNDQSVPDQGASVSVSARDPHSTTKRWSSLRLKRRDNSTSPIAKRQTNFSIKH